MLKNNLNNTTHNNAAQQGPTSVTKMYVVKRSGKHQPVHFDKISERLSKLSRMKPALDERHVDVAEITQKVISGIFAGVTTRELDQLAAETAAYCSSRHPDFDALATRIEVSNLHKQTSDSLQAKFKQLHEYKCPKTKKPAPLISDNAYAFFERNSDALCAVVRYPRDYHRNYFGFKTWQRSYPLRCDGEIVERPQDMFMRVSIGIHCPADATNCTQDENAAAVRDCIETYEALSRGFFIHATPTLFNAATPTPQMSSCFLLKMQSDSIEGIYSTLKQCALISKSAGGIGLAVSNVRASKSYIRGTNGESNGLVPMLRVYNNTARYVDQCFMPETLVYTQRGPREISTLKIGDEVVTAAGNFERVEQVLKHTYTGPMLEFTIENSAKKVRVTPEHQVLALQGQALGVSFDILKNRLDKNLAKAEMVDARDLLVGDFVCFPACLETLLSEWRTTTSEENFQHDGMMYSRIAQIDDVAAACENETVYDLEVANEHTYVTEMGAVHNGGGKRKGAFAIYLEPWHDDIFDFLELKKNHGAEESRARDLFYGLWIPDLFMRRVAEDAKWSLFCPNEAPNLDEVHSAEFDELYTRYEREGRARREVPAQELWRAIIESQIETGTPYMLYKDACNSKSNQQNLGTIKSSNLCCIASDQRVPTDRGMLTVGELYALGGKNRVVGRTGIESASEMLLPRPNAEMVRITTEEGYTHKVTPDHKVWLHEKGWCEAQNLTKGDKISIQQMEGLWGDLQLEDEAFLAGFIAGDGCYSKNTKKEYCNVHMDIWQHEARFRKPIEEMVARLIQKYAPDGADWRTSANPKFYECQVRRGSATKFRLSSSLLFGILVRLGVDPKNKHCVPEFVWKGSRNTVAKYLEGLYLADATVAATDEITSLSLAQSNLPFLEQVQLLWANFGVKCSLTLAKKKQKQQLMPCGGRYDLKAQYRLHTTSVQACKIVERLIGIGKHRCDSGKSTVPGQFLSNLATKDGYKQKMYARFKKLEVLPNEDAYCLRVETDEHSWIVNGMVTKNTEIIEYTSPEEIAVCNLASLALPKYVNVETQTFDHEKLRQMVAMTVRNLNKIIDRNYYPLPEARNSNLKHRPIGLGVQGLADVFILLRMPFASDAAKKLNREIFETIYFAAVEQSCSLAEQDGWYSSFPGSPMSKGQFQFDLWNELPESERAGSVPRWDWQALRARVVKFGTRNSLLVAPMPTASTSQILGHNECIEPYTSNIYTRRVLSGNFMVVNKHLVKDLLERDLWDEEMRNNIIRQRGSVQRIDRIPDDLKQLYKTVWEVSQRDLIDMAADRGIYVDQSQSFNVHLPKPSFSQMTSLHFYAWKKGLKTGMYYLRSKPSVDAIQFTITKASAGEQNNMHANKVQGAAADRAVEGEICTMQDGCISCGS